MLPVTHQALGGGVPVPLDLIEDDLQDDFPLTQKSPTRPSSHSSDELVIIPAASQRHQRAVPLQRASAETQPEIDAIIPQRHVPSHRVIHPGPDTLPEVDPTPPPAPVEPVCQRSAGISSFFTPDDAASPVLGLEPSSSWATVSPALAANFNSNAARLERRSCSTCGYDLNLDEPEPTPQQARSSSSPVFDELEPSGGGLVVLHPRPVQVAATSSAEWKEVKRARLEPFESWDDDDAAVAQALRGAVQVETTAVTVEPVAARVETVAVRVGLGPKLEGWGGDLTQVQVDDAAVQVDAGSTPAVVHRSAQRVVDAHDSTGRFNSAPVGLKSWSARLDSITAAFKSSPTPAVPETVAVTPVAVTPVAPVVQVGDAAWRSRSGRPAPLQRTLTSMMTSGVKRQRTGAPVAQQRHPGGR